MRIRAAKTLVFQSDGDQFVACNYLTKQVCECSYDLLGFLRNLSEWTPLKQVRRFAPGYSWSELRQTVDALLQMTVVVREGDTLAGREQAIEDHWRWGMPSAMMHFTVQDAEFLSLDQAEAMQRQKLAQDGAIELVRRHDPDCSITLPAASGANQLLQIMEKRRTQRQGSSRPVPLPQLSECLFAGMGITGETQNCVGSLPLGMTPSGGARNPYEAYVLARNVEGLAEGIYHYSASQHSLACQFSGPLPAFSDLVGGQEWADTMPCMILLCAHMDRTMWKYADANAYRVVMIEAGHIGQNVMLAATQHGLTACPTAALRHSWISNLLGMQNPTHAPVYALTLGYPITAENHSERCVTKTGCL